MVLSPTKDPKRNSKASIDRQQRQEQGQWLSPELFLESLDSTGNGFASDKVLQPSDLPNRRRSASVPSSKGAIHDESRCQEVGEDARREVSQPGENAVMVEDKGVVLEEQPRTKVAVEANGAEVDLPKTNVVLQDRVDLEQPKSTMVEDAGQVDEAKADAVEKDGKEDMDMNPVQHEENVFLKGQDNGHSKLGKKDGLETTSAKFPEANEVSSTGPKEELAASCHSQPAEETAAATTTTPGQGKVANAEEKNMVAVQESSMKDEATTPPSAATPTLSLPPDEVTNKEDPVDERIDTVSPRRQDRILKQQPRASRASQDFDDGAEDADVAPLPFSGPISLSGYSGPMSGGSISRRSDGSSTSTRSFAFPVLPFEWNASPARMPPPAKRRSFWRDKRDLCFRCICCTHPSTHP